MIFPLWIASSRPHVYTIQNFWDSVPFINSSDVTEPFKSKPVNASYCRPKVVGRKVKTSFISYENITFRVGSQNITTSYWVQYILFNVTSENFEEHKDNLCQLGQSWKEGLKSHFPSYRCSKFSVIPIVFVCGSKFVQVFPVRNRRKSQLLLNCFRLLSNGTSSDLTLLFVVDSH